MHRKPSWLRLLHHRSSMVKSEAKIAELIQQDSQRCWIGITGYSFLLRLFNLLKAITTTRYKVVVDRFAV